MNVWRGSALYCASGRHKDTEQRVSFDEIICYPLWSFLVATQTKNFLSFIFRFTAEGWGEEARKENARKFLGLPARVRERGRGASPRNRGVRFRFKPPRAPRVRSGFEQSLISHRRLKLRVRTEPRRKAARQSGRAENAAAKRRIGSAGGIRNAGIWLLFQIQKLYEYQTKIFSIRA